jgi:hypothetical protein
VQRHRGAGINKLRRDVDHALHELDSFAAFVPAM